MDGFTLDNWVDQMLHQTPVDYTCEWQTGAFMPSPAARLYTVPFMPGPAARLYTVPFMLGPAA